MKRTIERFLVGTMALAFLGIPARAALASPVTITFASGDYDNTLNTVGAGGALDNNQTTGKFRDVFWFSTRNPAGPDGAKVGSPDFINSGLNLISNGGSPARAFPGGTLNALNFTGDAPSGGQSYLTIYDTTPGDGTATTNTFSAVGGLTLSADVLFSPGRHSACGGVTSLYSQGQDGLSLLACNGGGNNPDKPKLDLVFKAGGPANNGTSPIILASQTLPGLTTFGPDQWYRVTLDLSVSGDVWNATGTFRSHLTGSDPNSALGAVITTLNASGTLSDPDTSARVLTNPGEVGIMALTNEGFSDGGCAPSKFPTADEPHKYVSGCNDNVGVSVTNFSFPDVQPVPEPASMLLMGSGLLGLRMFARKKR
jgi:hypothetical protein